MIVYKTIEEIAIMKEAAQVVSRTLGKIAEVIEPGITGIELDQLAEKYILSQNAVPGFKGLYGCPSTLLISINEQVVHGLPTDRKIKGRRHCFCRLWCDLQWVLWRSCLYVCNW